MWTSYRGAGHGRVVGHFSHGGGKPALALANHQTLDSQRRIIGVEHAALAGNPQDGAGVFNGKLGEITKRGEFVSIDADHLARPLATVRLPCGALGLSLFHTRQPITLRRAPHPLGRFTPRETIANIRRNHYRGAAGAASHNVEKSGLL